MVTNFYGFFNFFAWWSISIFFLFLVLFFPVSMFPFMMIAIIITIDKITFRIRFALVFFVCVLWRFSLKIQDFLFYIIFSYFFISYFKSYIKSCSFLISSCFHRDKIFLYTVYEFFDLFIQIVVMFWFWNLQ